MPDSSRTPQSEGAGSPSNLLPLVLGLVAVLGLVGIFGGMAIWMMTWMGGDHMGMHRGSSGADQTPVVSEMPSVTVEMRDFEFFPAKLTVNAGAEVTWINRDSAPHNAVARDGQFDTGRLDRDDSGSVLLDQPGAYSYECTYHPGMEAVLTVREPAP
jgi:plastocyanin